ncbi:MAG TPA: DUF411 domain-containing protein [Vicinamibacterales bacterium]|nr:DUF411 domain-containing protein [Vicinamibacterales bacterium]
MRTKPFVMGMSVLVFAGATLVLAQPKPVSSRIAATVWKTPTCGCCSLWVDHLRANGFQVDARDVSAAEVRAVSKAAGLSDNATSCHTAKIGNYVVEGHVPAADIHRMLKEKPAIAGIAAPGMPMGSPGMDQGGTREPYDVMAFTKGGQMTVFAKHK